MIDSTSRILFKKFLLLLFFSVLFEFLYFTSILSAQLHGDLVKAQGDDKIYIIQNGQKRLIVNEEIFNQMGFKKENIKELDINLLISIPDGPPLLSKEYISIYPDGTLIRPKGKAQVYLIRGGRKCFIPDVETFHSQGFRWEQVLELEEAIFNSIPTGIPLTSVKPPYQYGSPGNPHPQAPGSPYPPQPPAYPPYPTPPSANQTYPPTSPTYPSRDYHQPYPSPTVPSTPLPSYPPLSPIDNTPANQLPKNKSSFQIGILKASTLPIT